MDEQNHPFDQLADQLDAAARRLEAKARPRVARRWRRPRILLATSGALVGVSAAAWAASSLIDTGAPVPYASGTAPSPDRRYGTAVPDTVAFLIDDVPDPAGGPPWGMRTFTTTRGYGCIQVGRVMNGRLGVLALQPRRAPGLVGRGEFHELPAGPAVQASWCVPLDGANRAFVALSQRVTPEVTTPALCGAFFGSPPQLRRCAPDTVRVEAGLLGPRAERIFYRDAGREKTVSPVGRQGAYLLVRRLLRAERQQATSRAPLTLTPAAAPLTRVVYRDAPDCVIRPSRDPFAGACTPPPGITKLPRLDADEVRAAITAFAAPDRRGVRLRFTAPVTVADGRAAYTVQFRGLNARCPRCALSIPLERNVRAGEHLRTTIDLPGSGRPPQRALRRGRTYRVDVSLRTQGPYPKVFGALPYPGAHVGTTTFTVPK